MHIQTSLIIDGNNHKYNKNVYICAVAKGMLSITYFINAKRK